MKFKEILESAILAPSGDNCQPWEFVIHGNRIDIFNLPERDTSLFNYRQRASLVAHGALVENILIASSALGYKTKLSILPDRANPNLVATVELEESGAGAEPLYPFISRRSTNRKIYKPLPLTDAQRQSLVNSSKAVGAGEVRLVESEEEKRAVAKVIGLNDRLVFENRYLHSFLFDHIRWSDEEAQQTRDGLDIKTLELAPPDALAFRLFKNYSLLQALNLFGVSKLVAKNAEKLAMSASAIGIIAMSDSKADDYLAAGRVLQRVWLEATQLGLSFQLMTGITFLMQRVLDEETSEFTPQHVELIKEANEMIRGVMGFNNVNLVLMFRIGYSAPPSARSLRLPLERLTRKTYEKVMHFAVRL
jgi:nitroreductase